jgi:hypothetical protein
MKKLQLKSRKWLRKVFGCVSFTAVAFTFQACYGTEPDIYYDVKLTGTVRSESTNLPIKGIKIAVNNGHNNYGISDEKGEFSFYASVPNEDYYDYIDSLPVRFSPDSVKVHFLDIDDIENGFFADTTIIINPDYFDEVKIHVLLKEIVN